MKFHRLLLVTLIFAHTACDRKRDAPDLSAPAGEAPIMGFEQVWSDKPLTALELESLIAVLDTAARERTGIDGRLADRLLEGIGGQVPASMSQVSWRHFFNSSINALAATEEVGSDKIARVLMHVMTHNPDRVMRLYALQHMEIHQPRAQEPLKSEIGRRVAELAYEKNDEISGTALQVMELWNGEVGATGQRVDFAERSAAVVQIIRDAQRPADVRVTAMHTAVDGAYLDALTAARTIAADPEEDMMLRKAAIHLIGQLGSENDSALLTQCAAANPRLAQAAHPALERLSHRLEGRPEPNLTPYR